MRRLPLPRPAASATVLGGVLLVTGAVVTVQSALAAPPPSLVGIGQPVRGGDLEVVVRDVHRLADGHAGVNSPVLPMSGPGMAMPMAPGSAPDAMPGMAGAVQPGQERVTVTVALHNRGSAPLAYRPQDVRLLSRGRPVETVGAVASDLRAGELPPGARVEAVLQFVVPEGTAPLEASVRGVPSRFLLDATTRTPRTPAPATGGAGHAGHGG